MAIGFGSSSSTNGSDEMLGCESLPLSIIRLIQEERLDFATSQVKKKRHVIALVGSVINASDFLTGPFKSIGHI